MAVFQGRRTASVTANTLRTQARESRQTSAVPGPPPRVSPPHSLRPAAPSPASLFPKLLTTKSVCPPPCISRVNMNLAGKDQRPAGVQAERLPSLGQREARPPSKQGGEQDQLRQSPLQLQVPSGLPAPRRRNPAGEEAEGARAPRAGHGLAAGREGAPGSRPREAAHGGSTAQAPRASLRGVATHNATDNPPTRLRTGFPGAPRPRPCPGLGDGDVAARDPDPVPAPAAHPPLPRAPAAPLRRYRES